MYRPILSFLQYLLFVLSLALALLPFLPATIAGWLIPLSLAAIPLFILNLITLLLTFLPSRSKYQASDFQPHTQNGFRSRFRFRYLPVISTLLLLPCMSNYINVNVMQSVEKQFSFPLTLISFNADNFHLSLQTLHEFSDLVHDQDADIICLQERPHNNLLRWDSIKAAFKDYPYTLRNGREDEVLNLAVFSRYPLLGMNERYYPKSYNKQLFTDVIMGSDTIRLFNVHLQTTGLTDNRKRPRHAVRQFFNQAVMRNHQADDLVADVQASPYSVIVVGDFNDTRAGYAYRCLRSYLKDANPRISFAGSYQRFYSLYKIDHILCSGNFLPVSYELISNDWSDHKVQIRHI